MNYKATASMFSPVSKWDAEQIGCRGFRYGCEDFLSPVKNLSERRHSDYDAYRTMASVVCRRTHLHYMATPPPQIEVTLSSASPEPCCFSKNIFDSENVVNSRENLRHHLPIRRESFIYRSDSDFDNSPKTSRHSSIASDLHTDDIIVTPFAQVLHTLLNARDNVVRLTTSCSTSVSASGGATPLSEAAVTSQDGSTNFIVNSKPTQDENKRGCTDDEYRDLASKTVEDLDWCLKQLEAIQTTRSVSDMASNKFKRLLTKELSTMAGINRTSSQVSKYIETTFLDDRDAEMTQASEEAEIDENEPMVEEQASKISGMPVGAKPTMTKVPIKATLSSGSNDVNISLSTFGVDTPHEVELRQLMDNELDHWGMDIFKLHNLTVARPLTATTYAIFKRHGFLKKFNISPETLVHYFMQVEDHYRSDIPYHNAMHATDVLQSTHVLLSAESLAPVFSDLDKLSCIFSCAIHDVNHPGVTNQFLVNTKNELAIMYNDESVLENHHLAVSFRLLQEKNCDIFANLSSRDHKTLRKMVIDMVLATDMSKHMCLLADLKTIVETKKVQGKSILKLDSYADKIKILQNLVHCADLSNPAKPLHLYRMWTDRIMEEFFSQGDLEKKLGLEISPMCDRSCANIAASQVTFIDYIAHPLWEAWTELVHPDAEDIMNILENNRDWYNEQLNLPSNTKSEVVEDILENDNEPPAGLSSTPILLELSS